MSKPFEAGTDPEIPHDISSQIWRNYRLALGLGAAVLALGASIFVTYKTAAGDARPSISHIQPGSSNAAEQLVELYQESP